uniref:Essential protein Yae1 N-terminal domain-containing protein n=1 Tax=Oryza meridionalis TaxID=40149 RepID=A0A0E0CCZ5_9ORYZ
MAHTTSSPLVSASLKFPTHASHRTSPRRRRRRRAALPFSVSGHPPRPSAVASSMAGSEDLSGLTASLGELHVESSAPKDSEISQPGKSVDDDVWDDVWDSPGHGSTLDREWAHRQNQFHKMGYRDGIAEGQKDIAQEGFNVGFGQSVHVGYKWGLVRGITSALASLPDNLKEKMFLNVQCRGQLQDLNNSVQEISAENALQMFHESILQSSHSSEEPDATLKRATDSSRLQSLSKDLLLNPHQNLCTK